MKIRSIKAIEILDSRGCPTIETTVNLEDGSSGIAAVPSGTSTGAYEAVELRDNDPKRYNGLGVLQAVANVDKISEKLIGMEAEEQKAIDNEMIRMDGTDNKSNLGANAILSVSMAAACAQAKSEKKSLFNYLAKFNPDHGGKYIMPIPLMNIMNGGKHSDWTTDIQEYMILPVNSNSIANAVRMCAEVYFNLEKILKDKEYNTCVGDEGGFAPQLKSNEEPFELISEAVLKSGYSLGQDFIFAIDAAASEFYDNGKYNFKKQGTMTSQELSEFYKKLMDKYPIASLEDIFHQDDWQSFAEFTKTVNAQVVGDDLYATNIKRLKQGIEYQATNSILIKLNQIGTLTETIDVILKARENKMTSIISHRSGETSDSFIADLAVAMGTGQIKAGAPCRGERTAKYNRLIKIENKIEVNSQYAVWPWKR
ncbi:MAG: phosphopyruvate hydratase [bacterium]